MILSHNRTSLANNSILMHSMSVTSQRKEVSHRMVLTILGGIYLFIFCVVMFRYFIRYSRSPKQSLTKNTRLSVYPFLSIIIHGNTNVSKTKACVLSMLKQEYPSELIDLVIVDNDTSGNLEKMVRELQNMHSYIRIVKSPELPIEWRDHTHQCSVGAQFAKGEWYLFVNASTVAKSTFVTSALACVQQERLGFLIMSSKSFCQSNAEKIRMPFYQTLLDFTKTLSKNDTNHLPSAILSNTSLLINKEVYLASGGYESVRNYRYADIELFKSLKNTPFPRNYKFAHSMLSGTSSHSTLNYRKGYFTNITQGFKSTKRAIIAAITSLMISWGSIILPATALILDYHQQAPFTINFIQFICYTVSFVVMLAISFNYTRSLKSLSILSLLYPIGYTLMAITLFKSVRIQDETPMHKLSPRTPVRH